MPSLVNTCWGPKERDPMMVFLDKGDVHNNQLSFSDELNNAEGEQEDNEGSEKENQQLHPSQLKLYVMVNGNKISESEEPVGEISQEDKHTRKR
jgi:hypothetical protein